MTKQPRLLAAMLLGLLPAALPAQAQTPTTSVSSLLPALGAAPPGSDVLGFVPCTAGTTGCGAGGLATRLFSSSALQQAVTLSQITAALTGQTAAQAAAALQLGTAAGVATTAFDAAGVAAGLVQAETTRAQAAEGVNAGAVAGNTAAIANNTSAIGTKAPLQTVVTTTCTATQTLTAPNAYDVTLGANCSFTLGSAPTGSVQTILLKMNQGPTGGYTPGLPPSSSTMLWNNGYPSISTAANSVAMVIFRTFDGVHWLGSY